MSPLPFLIKAFKLTTNYLSGINWSETGKKIIDIIHPLRSKFKIKFFIASNDLTVYSLTEGQTLTA